MTVEESRQKLYMILEGVSLPEHEFMEAITTMMHAETAACRACAMAIDFLAEANRKVDALLTERDALKAQLAERSDAANHLAACVTGRDMAMSKLWRIVDDKADAYTSQEIYRAFRKWEASLRAMPPGADTVANTDELHGMAKVHLVPAGSEDL